jgi:hypothetical protein
MLQLSRNDIREYLKLAMAVGTESGMGVDTVLVQDTEAPKLRMPRVVIICEAERMKRFQPPMVTVTTFGAGAEKKFGSTRHSRSGSTESPGQNMSVGECRDGCEEGK